MNSSRTNSSVAARRNANLDRRYHRPPGRSVAVSKVQCSSPRPTDSSLARMVWEDDGGAGGPASSARGVPFGHEPSRSESHKNDWQQPIELISLPFAEYSALVPERLEALRSRLEAEPSAGVRFVILDVTRVSRPGGLLLGVLHVAAARLLKCGRCLVLAGDLFGLASISSLDKLCPVTPTRDAAFAWCRERLTSRHNPKSNQEPPHDE